MSVKRGLGRGFDTLIPTDIIEESLDPTAKQDEKLSDLRELDISTVFPDPDQPRRVFDENAIEELSRSIKEHGVLQPIIVIPKGDSFQIVAGERRYRGAQLAGLKKIPALVRTLDDQHRLEISLIENIQRRDLNPLETATAYLKLRDQFNLSLEEIGARVGGKSVSSVSNTLRLLKLPEGVRKALTDGALREGQARPLVGLDPEIVDQILPRILAEEWSARRIEQYIGSLKQSKVVQEKDSTHATMRHDDAITAWTKQFATKVQVRTNSKGAGSIVIAFKNDEEFERISKILNEN